jgi:hypothetical protein
MLIMLTKSVFPFGHQRLRLGGELGSAGLPGVVGSAMSCSSSARIGEWAGGLCSELELWGALPPWVSRVGAFQ